MKYKMSGKVKAFGKRSNLVKEVGKKKMDKNLILIIAHFSFSFILVIAIFFASYLAILRTPTLGKVIVLRVWF